MNDKRRPTCEVLHKERLVPVVTRAVIDVTPLQTLLKQHEPHIWDVRALYCSLMCCFVSMWADFWLSCVYLSQHNTHTYTHTQSHFHS